MQINQDGILHTTQIRPRYLRYMGAKNTQKWINLSNPTFDIFLWSILALFMGF